MQIKYFAIVPAHGTSPTYNGNNSENQTKKQANKTNAPHPQQTSLLVLFGPAGCHRDVTDKIPSFCTSFVRADFPGGECTRLFPLREKHMSPDPQWAHRHQSDRLASG